MSNINIANIIKNSNSNFLKSLPGFVIRLIAKIIRQKELNHILNKYSEFYGVDFLPKVIE